MVRCRKAEALGLRGYVKNLYSGNVEIVAEGERSLIEELIKEVKVGPRSARVSNLHLEWRELVADKSRDQFTHFEIR